MGSGKKDGGLGLAPGSKRFKSYAEHLLERKLIAKNTVNVYYNEYLIDDPPLLYIGLDTDDEQQRLLSYEWERAQKRVLFVVKQEYSWALKNGIAKEQARAVLPEGLTVSRMYMNGTLRSWIHYMELRASNGTQKEHQDIALACAKAIAEIFPMTSYLIT